MNTNAEIGSSWKGRILMKITVSEVDTPCASVRKIEDKTLLQQAANISRNNLWTARIKLYNAYYLPNKIDDYGIKIQMQDNVSLFTTKKGINGKMERIQNINMSDNGP